MNYKIRLEVFEGPLDLLLYLIKQEELDIADIPITRITEQYLEYLNLMEILDLEVAGEFLVMAATLMQIKSKMLLPPDPEAPAEEADPRAELVRRLLEYKSFKEASSRLRLMEEHRSGLFVRTGVRPEGADEGSLPLEGLTIFDLLAALGRALKAVPEASEHSVERDEYTVAEKIESLRQLVRREGTVRFSRLFFGARNRYEVITTFLALLELVRLRVVRAAQSGHFADIEIVHQEANP